MIFEAAHQIGLIPIVGMMLVGHRLPRAYWYLALGFFVSWFADSATHFLGGSWYVDYYWVPLQCWLVLLAFITDPAGRLASLVSLIFLSAIAHELHGAGPDLLLRFGGSIAILWFARGRLAPPLYIYFGLGTLAYLVMILHYDNIFPAWVVYQGCRLAAYVAFLWIIAPPLIRQKRAIL